MSSMLNIATCLILIGLISPASAATEDTIGKWGRLIIELPNSTYSGNPFLLEVDATFTHNESSTLITLPGYYAGGNVWKVAFMPTRTGQWTYSTSSIDVDLDNVSGNVSVEASARLGMLKADPNNPNKWKYSDGPYVVPIGVFVQIMVDTATTAEFTAMADFLKSNNIQLINFRLSENDLAFSDVATLQMNLPLWDRLEERMNILAARDIGITMMIYTDDSGSPSFGPGPESAEEQLLFRYMVARLASYPLVSFNTGIDLTEYRSQAWADWYGQYVRSLDPYAHPISSRHCCGTGNILMSGQSYNSVGTRNSVLSGQLSAFNDFNLPGQNDDNWSEQASGDNGHTVADIRRAGWKSTIAGGVGFHVRDNVSRCYPGTTECDRSFLVANIQAQLDSEDFLSLVNLFVQTRLGQTFATMVPDSLLVNSAGGKYALADPERNKILVLLIGTNDTWDDGDGGPVTLKLSSISAAFTANWFDPRTGSETSAGTLLGGSNYVLTPPSTDDWLLLLTKSDVDSDSVAPAAPTNLKVVD
ncbi:MAG: DUF5060 domain-containing protein [Proteobacteria bacterium]|nr:DUF5060 domain-containing protein [Pseudomonadota bacterium]